MTQEQINAALAGSNVTAEFTGGGLNLTYQAPAQPIDGLGTGEPQNEPAAVTIAIAGVDEADVSS